MEWNLTDKDKKRLRILEMFAKNDDDKSVIRKMESNKTLSMKDITEIRSALPQDAPLFIFLTKLTIRSEDVSYRASEEFRAKTESLRRQQENLAYKRIIRSVDASQKYGKVDYMVDFGAELKVVNRQLISVINVVITVAGAFFFGFSGVQYTYPQLRLDIATRFIIGLIPATVVFLADLYFIVKNMDHDDSSSKGSLPNVFNFKEMSSKKDD
ncbi:hypothetical protein KIN20_034381 [Parelaphostrongylus tenuis]|uniref:Transmembrane protein 199 n=1 Tax=Parelaphostrongylus tenuis TaxID=148309 RepID=A0AAD5R9L6_PARTN|nr:hypothetical protein KIN20_034381 [Parelaphostrongylus tenuis]